MLVIRRFNPYVIKSEVDTEDELQMKPSKKMTMETEQSFHKENRQTEKNNTVSVREFISKLDDIINERDGDKIKKINQEDERTKHQLVQIPPTERKKWPQKPCVYCRRNKVRRDTRYICSSCNTALCKDCFSKYHANIKKYILIEENR